ncbi:16S rRNA processing protein RimM [bacterium]|nr:16S rRNA processing protein RimM [bacterium]
MDKNTEDLIAIAVVATSFGVRGEIRAHITTDFPERFKKTEEVWLVSPLKQTQKFRLQSARFHKGGVLLKLEGIDSPEAAAPYRNWKVCIPESELMPLEDGEYWHFQLIGLPVKNARGEVLGTLREIMPFPGCDQYIIKNENGRELTVPAHEMFVKEINLKEGYIAVDLPEEEG